MNNRSQHEQLDSGNSNAAWPVWCSTTCTPTTKTEFNLANRQRLDAMKGRGLRSL